MNKSDITDITIQPDVKALVSVIIPCYNHGEYLERAINSVLKQLYQNCEIIVVDDGSEDNTKEVTALYPAVTYIYQSNQSLSAARNTGITNSKGKYLIFLDADDWLFDDAVGINLRHLNEDKKAAFVSGAHHKVNQHNVVLNVGKMPVENNHYQELLRGNYIGMHATVLYNRWIFDFFKYDTLLKACEDYDLYLKITRKFPVIHHEKLIAMYFIHNSNMSGDLPFMLSAALTVLKRQYNVLLNEKEKKCFREGIYFWTSYYCNEIYKKLHTRFGFRDLRIKNELITLLKYNRSLFFRLILSKSNMLVKRTIKQLSKAADFQKMVPATGKVKMGDFNRVHPFSKQFGYDRGGPIDRYYIENFLDRNKSSVTGRVLEIGDDEYTVKYGRLKIKQSDILHINEKNVKATFVGDLSNAPHLPDNAFDCIILTQTLHLIYDYTSALQTCYRVLKPGGTLLLTVPGITHIDQGEWKEIWLWSFTQTSIKKMLSGIFQSENIEVQTYGNVLAATAFLYGMGLPELTKKQLETHDPHYQVIITASATK